LVVGQFVSQLSATEYAHFTYDSSTKRVFELIRTASLAYPQRKTKVSCSWVYAPALEFYRQTSEVENIEPIKYVLPTPMTGSDFYVISGSDRPAAAKAGLREIIYYKSSDTALAVGPAQPAPKGPSPSN